jgi:hypothetical protein
MPLLVSLAVTGWLSGCGDSSKPGTLPAGTSKAAASKSVATDDSKTDADPGPTGSKRKKKFQSVQLGSDDGIAATTSATAKSSGSSEKNADAVVAALQPLQVLLGKWEGKTRQAFGGFSAVDELNWIWDFQTDRTQPGLKAKSDKSPYFKLVRVSYDPLSEKFQLTLTPREGEPRQFEGTWTDGGEPQEVADGKVTHRTYKLMFTELSDPGTEAWQIVLNQQDNDRYLLEMSKRPPAGKTFNKFDVVGTQRFGKPFAAAESDNPGPKCIISGGLGSMTVTYKGKSYPVCCSGCASAFNDDPERWLAKLAEKEKKKDE